VAARAQIDRLIAARPLEKDEIGFQTASLASARIRIAEGSHEAAKETLLTAFEYFRSHTLYYYEAQASLALAICEFKLDREPQMLEHLRRTVELAVRYDYEYWLKREIAGHADLFSREEVSELLPTDWRIQSITAELAVTVTTAVPTTIQLKTKPVTDLSISMLGPVEIFRDRDRPPALDAWTTRRARDIFCFIASRRHRRASKDTIIDTFWGETDLDVVEKNFHPTVSHIRKALNSNQPLKQNFLLYREGDYQLNPEFSYLIDIEEFDRLLAEGESARRARKFDECVESYVQAVTLYRGEFMQGSYEPWVDEQRTYYREQYLHLLEALAGVAQKTGEWTRSIQLAQQILHEDAFREDIHCLLMKAHVALGNRGAAREQYEILRRLLEKELGVEPGPETRKLYQELLNPKP
jgi:DNA-binding SARP family transcriptional activator